MKYAIIIPDGAADTSLDQLEGKSPLEAANTPTLDKLSTNGKQGTVATTPKGMTCGSDICTMSLLGYDPIKYHTGRAPLEAAALGINTSERDLIFRLNLVTIIGGIMVDHSAGHITNTESKVLLQDLISQLDNPSLQIFPGVSYRNIMIDKLEGDDNNHNDWGELDTTAPHDILDKPIKKYMPAGSRLEKILCNLIDLSEKVFANHEINLTRSEMGETKATHVWPWGQGKMPKIPGFAEKFGIENCAMITAVDLLGGLAKLIGFKRLDVPGQTSYHDNDYQATGKYAASALENNNLVCVHIEAPDEASHAGDAKTKTKSIEAIDQKVIAPIFAALEKKDEPYRILILPDHYTRTDTRKHDPAPVPFLLYGDKIHSVLKKTWSEKNAQQADLHISKGHELMEYFLFSGLDSTQLKVNSNK